MKYIKEDFISLITSYQSIQFGKKRLAQLQELIFREKLKIQDLERKVEKEYQDINALESKSIHWLFSKILKDNEKQLEKERQEYLVVVMEYRESLKLLELYEYELDVIQNKSKDEIDILNEIENSLLQIDDQGNFENPKFFSEIKHINHQLSELTKLKIEAFDVSNILDQIKDVFYKMISNLNEAQEYNDWGEFYNEIQYNRRMKKTIWTKRKKMLML